MTLDCLTSIKKYPQLKYRIAEEARLNPSAKLTCLYQYFFFYQQSSWPCLHQNEKVNGIFNFIESTSRNVTYVLTSIISGSLKAMAYDPSCISGLVTI